MAVVPNAALLAEIGEVSVLYCDPEDVVSIASTCKNLIEQHSMCQSLWSESNRLGYAPSQTWLGILSTPHPWNEKRPSVSSPKRLELIRRQ